jgi:hypothetical protein
MSTKSTSNFKPKQVTKLDASLVAREMYHTRMKNFNAMHVFILQYKE